MTNASAAAAEFSHRMVNSDRLSREITKMWLPTSVYERVPQFWLVLGLLFMVSGLYLGTEYHMAFLYVGVGAACVLWGVAVAVWRRRFRTESFSRTVALSLDAVPGQDVSEDPEEPSRGN